MEKNTKQKGNWLTQGHVPSESVAENSIKHGFSKSFPTHWPSFLSTGMWTKGKSKWLRPQMQADIGDWKGHEGVRAPRDRAICTASAGFCGCLPAPPDSGGTSWPCKQTMGTSNNTSKLWQRPSFLVVWKLSQEPWAEKSSFFCFDLQLFQGQILSAASSGITESLTSFCI